jgi:hypothetical protein
MTAIKDAGVDDRFFSVWGVPSRRRQPSTYAARRYQWFLPARPRSHSDIPALDAYASKYLPGAIVTFAALSKASGDALKYSKARRCAEMPSLADGMPRNSTGGVACCAHIGDGTVNAIPAAIRHFFIPGILVVSDRDQSQSTEATIHRRDRAVLGMRLKCSERIADLGYA